LNVFIGSKPLLVHLLIENKINNVKYLLENGVDVSFVDDEGSSLVHYLSCNLEALKLSIIPSLKLDFNLPSKSGWTPLAIATFCERIDIVQQLVELGANPDSSIPSLGLSATAIALLRAKPPHGFTGTQSISAVRYQLSHSVCFSCLTLSSASFYCLGPTLTCQDPTVGLLCTMLL